MKLKLDKKNENLNFIIKNIEKKLIENESNAQRLKIQLTIKEHSHK